MKTILKTLAILSFILMVSSLTIARETNPKQADSQDAYYLIGPDDVLNIFVWKEPELTQDVLVMPDGRIIFPMIGEIMAKGKSVIELKDIITEKLEQYVTGPEVTVIVRESNSRVIYTIGRVNQPGPFRLAPDMTVLQALSRAGGFAEWADNKSVMVVRRVNGNETMHRFNYQDFISGRNLEQNILLQPNDTIVVP